MKVKCRCRAATSATSVCLRIPAPHGSARERKVCKALWRIHCKGSSGFRCEVTKWLSDIGMHQPGRLARKLPNAERAEVLFLLRRISNKFSTDSSHISQSCLFQQIAPHRQIVCPQSCSKKRMLHLNLRDFHAWRPHAASCCSCCAEPVYIRSCFCASSRVLHDVFKPFRLRTVNIG